MSIDWFRDLVICIAGLVFTGVLIFVAVMSYSLYKRTRSALDSTRAILASGQRVSSYIQDEAMKPLVQLIALVQGIRQGIETFSTLFKKHKEGGGDV